jgi:hypothetical protein
VLALAVLAAGGALVLDLSASAPRTAGSDHIAPLIFSAAVPAGGHVCQPMGLLPGEAARVEMTVGTYGKPMPRFTLRFLNQAGRTLADGMPQPGAHEGVIVFELHHFAAAGNVTQVCLQLPRSVGPIAVGGEGVPPGSSSELIDGHVEAGLISLIYLRRGNESWWQLLPTLAERFGFGKSPSFGSWLLPLASLALLGVWILTMRLLARELR